MYTGGGGAFRVVYTGSQLEVMYTGGGQSGLCILAVGCSVYERTVSGPV